MAETYHIYDLRALPVRKLATLALGLSKDSRVMMAMAGAKLTTVETLLCLAVDGISTIAWMQTKDGAAGRNRPKSLLEELTKEKPTEDFKTFQTLEDFEAARRKIIGG
jgi:hypothetical protein